MIRRQREVKEGKYEVVTLQYGLLKDTYIHQTIDSVLNDLETIRALSSVEVLEIRENGKKIVIG